MTLNAAIIPNLVGNGGTTTGAGGGTGSANSFMTYDSTTGLRPLNLADEYEINSIVANGTYGNNTYISSATASSANNSVNSLVIGAATLTINDGTTLTDSSGAVLFSGGGTIAPSTSTGTLAFGGNKAYIDTAANATISSLITGSGGLVKTGSSQLNLTNTNTFTGLSGGIYILNGTLSSSVAADPFGSNTIYLGDTGGSNSATLRWYGGSSGTTTVSNPIVVQGGNTGTSLILGGNNPGNYANYTGTVTLGSMNASGTWVGHNLSVDEGTVYASVVALNLSGPIQDPNGGTFTGTPGVVYLTVESQNNGSPSLGFGNPNSTYTGGTVISISTGVQNENTPQIAFNNGTGGTIFGTGNVTINGMNVNDTGNTTILGANTQVWNQDWVHNDGNTLNWGLTGTVDLGNIATGSVRTVTNNGGTLTIAGILQTGTNGITNTFAKAGGGSVILTGASTYNGPTIVESGTLQVATINSVSNGNQTTSSNLGAPSSAANGIISLGFGGSTGTLLYTGATYTTDRVINLSGTTGGATITNNGSGPLTFTSNLTSAPIGAITTVAGAKTLTLNGNVAGNAISGNIVNLSATYPTSLTVGGTATWTLSGTNAFSGTTTLSGGILQAGSNTALGTSTVNFTAGTLQYGAGITHDFSNQFGTGASQAYSIDTNGQPVTFGTALTSSGGTLTKLGAGTLTLGAANTFSGAATVQGGTLTLNGATGSLNSAMPLTFNANGGTFAYDNTSSSGTPSQSLGALTTTAGEDTVSSILGSGATSSTLTFSSLTARTAGATLNFSETGGTPGTNKIVLTGATASALISKGTFFNGSSYAAYDSGGFVRAYNYGPTGADTGAVIAPTGATVGTVTSASNVELTGNITGQTVATANTVDLNSNNLTLSNTTGSVLTVNGLLESGGSSTISTATGAGTGQGISNGGFELAVRSNLSTDSITISSVISGSGGLTKSGAGSLVLSGANTYGSSSTNTTVDAGTLDINSPSALGTTASSALVLNTGSTIDNTSGGAILESTNHALTLAGDFTFGGTGALNLGTGAVSLGANETPFRTITANGPLYTSNALTLGGIISNGTNTVVPTDGIIKAGTGSVVLGGANTYTGGTTVNAGSLYVNGGVAATSSGTGTGMVVVNNTGILAGSGVIKPSAVAVGGAGVTVNSGGRISSGGIQTSDSTHTVITGAGLTLDNTAAMPTLLNVLGGSTLSFNLGSGTTAGSGVWTFNTPNLNATYMNVVGNTAGEINFGTTSSIKINIVDLTAFSSSASLQLNGQVPYLLIQTGSNTDFTDLVTTGGLDQNGFVKGVGTISSYTPFTFGDTDINGNPVAVPYNNLQLYLYNGDLEIVPEPGTWALMLGGLALLVVIQRRRNKLS